MPASIADHARGFLACRSWLADALAGRGPRDRAVEDIEAAAGHADDLGLMPEMADPADGSPLGTFPQAPSHVALIHAAHAIEGRPEAEEQP